MASTWYAANLITKLWDKELVVFNLDSGNTHLLSPLAGQVLKILMQGPADVQELARQMAANVEIEFDPDVDERLEAVIQQFDALGIIYPLTE